MFVKKTEPGSQNDVSLSPSSRERIGGRRSSSFSELDITVFGEFSVFVGRNGWVGGVETALLRQGREIVWST